MSIVVDDASLADLPAILALYNHHAAHTTALWRSTPVDLADRRSWFEERRAKGFPVLAARSGDLFMGFASYGPFRVGEGYEATVENSVYVEEEAQGRGAATALMRALIDRAAADGRRVMVAAIGLPNDASIALHRSLGFEERGVLPGVGRKFDRSLDLLFMQKALQPPALP